MPALSVVTVSNCKHWQVNDKVKYENMAAYSMVTGFGMAPIAGLWFSGTFNHPFGLFAVIVVLVSAVVATFAVAVEPSTPLEPYEEDHLD